MRLVAAMIVKNEAAVLGRCLDSLRPHVQHVIINDNGSTDGTMEVIAQQPSNVPFLVPGEWVDFSINRNLALNVARMWGDYVLCGIDADEELVVEGQWPQLDADAYTLDVKLGELVFRRTAIVRSAASWQWRYPIHEGLYPQTDKPVTIKHLTCAHILSHRDGARSKDRRTQERDLATLRKAAKGGDPRMTFYLAQQLRDMRQIGSARLQYERRLQLGGWEEERWYAQYMIARCKEWMDEDPVRDYIDVFEQNPERSEPLYHAAEWCRQRKLYNQATMYASMALLTPPENGLFIERDVYDWRLQDVLGAAAYYTPYRQLGISALNMLLAQAKFPAEHTDRIIRNRGFYLTPA